MTKVKIVQIAVGLSNQESIVQYLDDKGRVWYDDGHTETYHEKSEYAHPDNKKSRWVTVWKQLEMPDEPEVES